jgi:hypothetical protein
MAVITAAQRAAVRARFIDLPPKLRFRAERS